MIMIVPLMAVTPTPLDQPLNPPSPGMGESQQNHQPSAAKEHQQGDGASTPPHNLSSVVPNNQSPNQNAVASKPKDQSGWYADPNWWVAGFTGALVVVTGGLWLFTALLWRETRNAVQDAKGTGKIAVDAANAANAHVKESARAAAAMEAVSVGTAESIRITAEIGRTQREFGQKQMRAYLSVTYNITVPQNEETKQPPEIRLHLFNTGNTPASRVSYKANAAMLPFPLPDDFAFPIDEHPVNSEGVLGHGQSNMISCALPSLLSAEQIDQVTDGRLNKLYIWGIVTYQDVFNYSRETRFSQSVVWMRNGHSMGVNTRRHNEAT